ncbi:hypothetical protein BsWGS_16972 [Bradybaena similaris]
MSQRSPQYAQLDLPPRTGGPPSREGAVEYAKLAFPEEQRTSAADSIIFDQNNCPLQRDLKFESMNVMLLRQFNFESFISTKEKVLIYFYTTNKPQDRSLEAQFSDAADKTTNPNYGFASVDCLYDNALCEKEKIKETPTLKLFSNGYELSTLNSLAEFNSQQMRMLMKMTPVLSQPRVELGKEYLKHPEPEMPKKRSKFLCL